MKIITLLTMLFSFSVHAATFKTLKLEEVESKPLVSVMKELAMLSDIEDTGVQAIKIFSKGNQSLETIVRQNDRINGADETSAKIVENKNSASSITEGFMNSLIREDDEVIRTQIQKKLTSVLNKVLSLKSFVVLTGGASFRQDAYFDVITIVDTKTMEMVQIHTGYAE